MIAKHSKGYVRLNYKDFQGEAQGEEKPSFKLQIKKLTLLGS